MHAQKKQNRVMLGSIVFSVALLSSCGSGIGDQTDTSNLPEVGQAMPEQAPEILTAAPNAPVQVTVPDTIDATPLIPPEPDAEVQPAPEVVPEPEVVPLPETPVEPLPVPPEEEETTEEPPITEPPEAIPPEPPVAEPPDVIPPEPPETIPEETPEPLVNVACTATQADIQTSTLQLINEARSVERMCGGVLFEATTALTWNTKLQDAALGHSLDMTQNNFFAHVGSDGATASQRVDAQRYDWRSVGENIAAGQPTTELVIQAWLDSPGHCANLMNPNFEETAVVCVEDNTAQYRQYWTNVLGTSF